MYIDMLIDHLQTHYPNHIIEAEDPTLTKQQKVIFQEGQDYILISPNHDYVSILQPRIVGTTFTCHVFTEDNIQGLRLFNTFVTDLNDPNTCYINKIVSTLETLELI